MELVTDEHGDAAPRLNDVAFSPEDARRHHATLLVEVMRMLCAGVVHGDLSEFNILLGCEDGVDGPVIIDLPQAVDAAGNNHAKRMLLRDVDNLRNFFGQFAPDLLPSRYGEEIWALYEGGMLSPDTPLTGTSRARPAQWMWAACCVRLTTRGPRKVRGGCGWEFDAYACRSAPR